MSYSDKFIRASDKLVEFEAYFSEIQTERHTIHSLDIQKDEILCLWSDFRKAYDNILANFDTETEMTVESLKKRFYETFDAHVKALSKANEILDSLKAKNAPVVDTLPSSNDINPIIYIPPCDTQTFYGDYVSWPSFRDMFTALYINNTRLSPVEKLFHLLKKTEGEPRDILRKNLQKIEL